MMPATIRIASLDNPTLWDALQARAGMPSQSKSYASAFATPAQIPQLALVEAASGGFLSMLFYEREWCGTTDICTFLSVSGSWAADPVDGLVDAWTDFAGNRGWVAGYLQFAPDCTTDGLPGLQEGNQVFLFDLTQADRLAAASQLIRRKLKRAVAQGAVLVEDRAILADALARLYPEAMLRVGASAAYIMTEQALRNLAVAPDILIIGAAVGANIESVMVFPTAGRRAEFFINAGTDRGRDLNAWLLAQAMDLLAATGHTVLNLGGGVKPGDGLYQFKAMFGAAPRPLRTLRQIYRPDLYARMLQESGATPDNGWFPAYRGPVSTAHKHAASS